MEFLTSCFVFLVRYCCIKWFAKAYIAYQCASPQLNYFQKANNDNFFNKIWNYKAQEQQYHFENFLDVVLLTFFFLILLGFVHWCVCFVDEMLFKTKTLYTCLCQWAVSFFFFF